MEVSYLNEWELYMYRSKAVLDHVEGRAGGETVGTGQFIRSGTRFWLPLRTVAKTKRSSGTYATCSGGMSLRGLHCKTLRHFGWRWILIYQQMSTKLRRRSMMGTSLLLDVLNYKRRWIVIRPRSIIPAGDLKGWKLSSSHWRLPLFAWNRKYWWR